METRSRKRAEASSSTTNRANRRPRLTAAPAAPSVCTRSRAAAAAAAAAAAPMETAGATESSSSRGGRRRGQSGKAAQQAEADGHGGNDGGGSGKGKEKEVEVKGRETGFDGSGSGAGDDDDSEGGGGVGLLHQNLSSASSALQGLLRKLGAGLDDLLPSSGLVTASSSHQNGRLKKILSGLRADGEEGRQVEALTQLCEMLSICTEDSLATFSVDSFVPVLVGLLNHESNPDIMLLAARAITHLCDVLPSSCSAVVHYGAVPCFCARLLTIEYMDLAEQSLQALKKISQEHPTACLRAGALMAVLSYLDFFSTGVQRVALSTAANMCKKLPSDAADFVMDAIPLLTNLLQYHDAKVLEHASVCLTRIAEAFASSSEKLDALCNHGLVAQAASLISISNSGGGQASLSTSTYTGLIRLLSICASGSALAAKTLLLLGISSILKDILSGSGQVSSVSTSPALTRPPEQIFEIVNLADELLPPLPQGTISLPTSSFLVKGSSATKKSVTVSDKKEDSEGIFEMSAREKLLHEQPELLQQFGLDLLPVLIQIYGSSVNSPVRHKCLSVIGKLMYFSTADMIESLLGITNVASFLAGVLAWKDPQVLIPALQIAKILMEKLPGTFSKMFVREGVVHAVEMLVSADSSPSSQAGTTEKEKETSQGPSRTRRGRRRSGSQSVDVGSTEDSKASAAGVSSTPPSSVETPVSSNHRATVSTHAKAFKDKYFPADPGSSELFITDDLLRLKNLCAKLSAGADNTKTKGKGKSKATTTHLPEMSSCNEGHLIGVISELLSELSKDDGVSTFEFIGSGVVLDLLNYLSCGTFAKEIPEADMLKFRQQAIKRFKSFISVALPAGIHETNNQAPMSLLVSKLQNALSSLERFPVVLSHPSRSSTGTARLSSGLSALAQPFKLRLCRAHGDKSLRDYSSNIVLIDPLASLAAIEAFLWPRVHRGESGQKSLSPTTNAETTTAPSGAATSPPTSAHASSVHRPSTRSRSSMSIGVGNSSGDGSKKDSHEGQSNSLKGKGKAVMKPSDDAKGPQTRTSTRRKAALEKDAHMKSVDTDISSEDEDMDDSHLDIDDELVIEEEDISEDDDDQEEILEDSITVSMLDKVHDVKLSDAADVGATVSGSADSQTNTSGTNETGNSVRGADSAEFRGRAPFGSRGALTFAAAAMAGLTSVSGRGIRGSRDRHGLLIGSSNDPPRLVFSAGGKQLSRNLTIYQAVQRQLALDEDEDERYTGSDFLSSDGSRMWSDVYTITYQKADNQVDHGPSSGSASSSVPKSGKSGPASSSGTNTSWKQTSLLDSILQGNLPCDMEKSNPTYNILALLRVLNGLNQLAPRLRMLAASDDFAEGRISNFDDLSTGGAMVSCDEFINSKLTPKLARQIQDALALCSGSLPSWCYQLTKSCPFLFSFETRRQFFNSTAFGLSRALHRLGQQQGSENQGSAGDREVRVGRLQRQKVRVSRNRILESAAKVMEMYSSQKAVLEVEYFGEVGTGLGPTLEFYTLVSHELQKVSLGMWRSSPSFGKSSTDIDLDEQKDKNVDSDAKKLGFVETGVMAGIDYVHAPLGLFPRPWPPSADNLEGSQYYKVIDYFRLIGRVMAKALQDGRLLDLPLSPAFYKLILGQELDLQDIFSIDAEFGKTLRELQVIVHRKQHLESVGGTDLISDLHFRGSPIEDLCLDFTLPGYPDYVLKPGEENMMIDINNLEEYVSLVVDATVRTGIMRQMDAFRAGFNQVFDITSLQIFSPYELDYLLCGRRELWKAETLVDHLKFDHGYTAKSPAIVNLLEIMGEFAPDQQRAFCQFVTGAPQLPPGGLAVLNPKLTIVRKHTSSVANMASNGGGLSESADDDLLPSVMTCANYLKLPSYSTKEIMYKKLLYAIREGQGSFDLS